MLSKYVNVDTNQENNGWTISKDLKNKAHNKIKRFVFNVTHSTYLTYVKISSYIFYKKIIIFDLIILLFFSSRLFLSNWIRAIYQMPTKGAF